MIDIFNNRETIPRDKLTESQQWNLIYCFHRKLWRGYWGLKKKYLIANEKGEN